MKPDPKVRKNRKCACGCGKPLATITERHRRYGGDVLLGDPFATTECCRKWHGTTLAKPSYEPTVTAHSRPSGGFKHGTREGYRLCACPLCTEAMKR